MNKFIYSTKTNILFLTKKESILAAHFGTFMMPNHHLLMKSWSFSAIHLTIKSIEIMSFSYDNYVDNTS